MAGDLRALLETLDDAIKAYLQRIRDLELTVENQQKIIEGQRAKPPSEAANGN